MSCIDILSHFWRFIVVICFFTAILNCSSFTSSGWVAMNVWVTVCLCVWSHCHCVWSHCGCVFLFNQLVNLESCLLVTRCSSRAVAVSLKAQQPTCTERWWRYLVLCRHRPTCTAAMNTLSRTSSLLRRWNQTARQWQRSWRGPRHNPARDSQQSLLP